MGTGNNYILIYDAAFEAARTGNDNKLKEHIKSGIDVDSIDEYGYKPLETAFLNFDMKVAKILLENGADPNQKDKHGNPLLNTSVQHNSVEGVKMLAKYGADFKALDNMGNTILEKALCDYSLASPKMINLLLDLWAKPREDELSMLVEWLIDKKCYTILIKVFEELEKTKEIK